MPTERYAANEADLPRGTLGRLFLESVDRYGRAPAFQTIVDGSLEATSYREAFEAVKLVAGGLDALGVERGDRVALLSENRLEWALTDYGCLCIGAQLVPVYSTLTAAQAGFILENSGARVLFVQDREQLEKGMEACAECEHEIRIVTFEGDDLPNDVLSWEALLEKGRGTMEGTGDEAFRKRVLETDPDDVATMIYTSGTTGPPKGVMLTHDNLHSNVLASCEVLPVGPDDQTLSFLPLAHVLQRMVDYLFFRQGCTIAYAQDIRTVPEDLVLVKPTKVVSVPRLYEKVYQRVVDQSGIKGKLVAWARSVGERHADARLAGRKPGPLLRLQYALATALVFKKIKAGVGGRLEFFISGGAPLSAEINKFFYAAGVKILEGYGLTETSPVTNVNLPERIKIGTVGPPVPGTEIRIADDGEILVRGRQVMKGYFNRPDDTAEVITGEGWFHTGDIGELDADGYLSITGRKKDLIVTAGGKNIAPQPIENRLTSNPFIDQAVMVGDGRKFVALLVVPAFEKLEAWAAERDVEFSSRGELIRAEAVQERIRDEVFGELEDLARYEKPKKIALLDEEFTVEGGALTPTQKVKRRVVEERYEALIDAFYREENLEKTVFVAGEERAGSRSGAGGTP